MAISRNLLAREAESANQPLQRALRRASRRALLCPVEAADLDRKDGDLTQLSRVGPYLGKLILQSLRKGRPWPILPKPVMTF